MERGHLTTERPNPASEDLDLLGTDEALLRVQDEDRRIHDALAAARPDIARAVELTAERLEGGGRLIYVGAGTSGRLAMLDAVECPPTFQSDPETVQAVVAGGAAALVGAVEGAEDDADGARAEIEVRGTGPDDVVLGIAAGGTTPFVHAALAAARERGAATIFLACVPREEVPDEADVSIRVVTGPEVLAGSTRLKAGTATKLVLNAITTLCFARLGKVYGNRMVDVNTRGNAKLVERGTRLVAELCELPQEEAAALLQRAEGGVKVAVVMQRRGLSLEGARGHLERHGGRLRSAIDG